MNAKEFVKGLLYKRSEVDDWIAGKAFPFGRYDPDLGYVHRDRVCEDGIDGSTSTFTYDKRTWARRIVNYPDSPCRINTYGDSYTSCEQVNDGETWQEILAAHLGEPIRNFGIGAYSVYQMYLRMVREESQVPAKHIIMNVYDDDHYRSLVGWQRMRFGLGTAQFHPPQPYVRANPTTKEFSEFTNPSPEPKDLYDFCDLERTYERFKDDFCLHIMLAKTNVERGAPTESYKDIEELAEEHGVRTTIGTPEKLLEVANALYTESAIYASMRIVEKVEEFTSKERKDILYVMSYSASSIGDRLRPGDGAKVPEMRKPGYSFNEAFASFMRKRGRRCIDLMDAHLEDFSTRKMDVPSYLKEYYVDPDVFDTHYAPLGNHFTAYAVKDRLVETLDPSPTSYRRVGPSDANGKCVAL